MDPQENNPPIENTGSVTTVSTPTQPETVKESTKQVPEASSKKPRRVIILYPTVLLLILVSIVAGYLGYQNHQLKQKLNSQIQPTPLPQESPISTPNPIADWEQYSDDNYGFEIKYPKNYYVDTEDNGNIILAEDKWRENPVHHPYLAFSKTTTLLSIDEWVSQQIQNAKNEGQGFFEDGCTNNCISKSFIETKIGDNIRALEYKDWGVSGGNNYVVVKSLSKPNQLITIIHHIAGSRDPGEDMLPKDILNEILISFKFINGDTQKTKECYESLSCEGGIPCMTNPASKFCQCMGGVVETKEGEAGQYGICTIQGKEYDEWEYFRLMNPEDTTYSQ